MEIFFIAIIALIFGSFATCISYRVVRGEDWMFVRSKCPKCGVKLSIRNLAPLFSWLFQKGRCSKCHAKISPRYPMVELLFLIIFLTIYFALYQKIDTKFVILCLVATIFIIMSIIDIEKYFIPDILQVTLVLLAVGFAIADVGFARSFDNFLAALLLVASAFILYYLFYIITKKAALGIDDIKLLFAIGLLLGFSKLVIFTFFAGLFGMIFGSIWIKLKKEKTFPFAPALCTAAFVSLFINTNFYL